MLSDFRKLYDFRYLLWMWTKRDILIRYKQSFLGAAWAIVQPLSLMLIFSVIFSIFVKIPSDGLPYPVFAYVGLLPWTFFANSISFGVPSLVANMNLITKIYFPREILTVTPVGAGLLDFGLGFLVFLLLMLFYRVAFSWTLLWVPLLLAIQILLCLGVILFASAANVFYRDIRFVVPLAIQLWFYASPVIYSANNVPAWLRPFYILNPMAGLIDGYRRVVLLGLPPAWDSLAAAALISVALFGLAYRYFKSVEPKFADLV
jgi:lipopolysaccharide transport system permease protein